MNIAIFAPTTAAAKELYEVAQVLALVGDEQFVREGLLGHLHSRAPVMLASETTPASTESPKGS